MRSAMRRAKPAGSGRGEPSAMRALTVQQVGVVGEQGVFAVGLVAGLHSGEQGVVGVELEDALLLAGLLAALFEQAFEAGAQVVLVADEADRGTLEARGEADLLDVLVEGLRDEFEQRGVGLLFLFAGFFGLLALFFGAEFDLSLADRLQLLVFELGDMADEDLVDGIGEEEDFVAFVAEGFEVGGAFAGGAVFAGDVVDGFLAVFHALDVFGEAGAGFASALIRTRAAARRGLCCRGRWRLL
jgi:hypothetical protein